MNRPLLQIVFNDLLLESSKVCRRKGGFESGHPQKSLFEYTNYCYNAQNKKPESALNKALSGKAEIIC